MSADARLKEIRARVEAATPGPWAANPGGHPGILTRAATGDILAVLGGGAQDEADADFIAHSRTDTGFLLDLLDKYVGKEPTLRDEMAYLNRCLNAVFEVCREAEKQATRWEQPLPVPEWVDVVRKAAGGEHPVEDEVAELRRQVAELQAAAGCPSVARAYGSRCALPIRHQGDHRNADSWHYWDDSHALPAAAEPTLDDDQPGVPR